MSERKQAIIGGDAHSGANGGLVHPDFRGDVPRDILPHCESYYNAFIGRVKELGPIDICVHNGDGVSGRGEKSGGLDNWTSDTNKQAENFARVLMEVNAKKYLLTYGTPYHTGKLADVEYQAVQIMREAGCDVEIGDQQFFTINGLQFHAKHKISGSSIPHGRQSAIARANLWNLFWAEHGEVPKCDVIIRSHRHSYDYVGRYGFLGVVTPALCGWGDRYGSRECEGTIDFGFLSFNVTNREDWTWNAHVWRGLRRVNNLEL